MCLCDRVKGEVEKLRRAFSPAEAETDFSWVRFVAAVLFVLVPVVLISMHGGLSW